MPVQECIWKQQCFNSCITHVLYHVHYSVCIRPAQLFALTETPSPPPSFSCRWTTSVPRVAPSIWYLVAVMIELVGHWSWSWEGGCLSCAWFQDMSGTPNRSRFLTTQQQLTFFLTLLLPQVAQTKMNQVKQVVFIQSTINNNIYVTIILVLMIEQRDQQMPVRAVSSKRKAL